MQIAQDHGETWGRILSFSLLDTPAGKDLPGMALCLRCRRKGHYVREVELLSSAGELTKVIVGWCKEHYEEARTMARAIDEPCIVCRNPYCDGRECYEDEDAEDLLEA